MDEDKLTDILMGIKEDVGELKASHSSQNKQIGMIWSRLAENGDHCAQGARNAVAIKWLYTVGSICIGALAGAIAFFHSAAEAAN